MNKTSTAVYMLIVIVAFIAIVTLAKPALVDKAGVPQYQLKLFNFKAVK